jgi:phosphate uptake regulator
MSEYLFKEELRKVQVTGGSTFIISLPKPWVEQVGLTRGSLVSIRQKDPLTLCLQPKGVETDNKIKKVTVILNEGETSGSVVRRVVSSYLLGYNIIQIKELQNRIMTSIRFAVKDFTRKKLVGTEILSDLPNELTLQVLLSYAELSVKDALRRMSIIAASMHRDAIEALKTEDPQLAREIISMDDEVDRFNLYIIRLLKVASSDSYVLRESGLKNPREVLGYRLITKSIERMADHAVNIAQNRLTLVLTQSSSKILVELESLSENALQIFENAVDALFNQEYKAADKVLEDADKSKPMEAEVIQKIIKHAPPEEVPALRLIVESIRRTAEYGADIAEIVLNMTIKEEITEIF